MNLNKNKESITKEDRNKVCLIEQLTEIYDQEVRIVAKALIALNL